MMHQKETGMYIFVFFIVVHALTVERTIIHKINVEISVLLHRFPSTNAVGNHNVPYDVLG
jgi:hypothetical protein